MTPEVERQAVWNIVADTVMACLWDPTVCESHGETAEHDVRAWKEAGVVKAEVKRK